jgi:hypothetical protein
MRIFLIMLSFISGVQAAMSAGPVLRAADMKRINYALRSTGILSVESHLHWCICPFPISTSMLF